MYSLIQSYVQKLEKSGHDNAKRTIEELLAHHLSCSPLEIYNFESVNILELGAYEGRSAIYMLENFCKHKNSKITTVDWKLNPQKEILEKNIQTYNSNKLKYIEGNFTGFEKNVLKGLKLSSVILELLLVSPFSRTKRSRTYVGYWDG